MVRSPLTPAELERGRRLGALLRRARGERTLPEVAAAAGFSPETLRKIESGRVATPAFTTVAAVAGVLGLSLDALWADLHPVGAAAAGTGDTAGGMEHAGGREHAGGGEHAGGREHVGGGEHADAADQLAS